MTELDLIETDKLAEELKNRFDVFVMIGVQSKTSKERDTYYNNYKGGISNCIGLLEIMKSILKRNYFDSKEEVENLE